MACGTGWGQGCPNLTQSQIAQLWVANGGNPAQAQTAAAIALAESGGNPNAIGDNGDSCGLWQIDTAYHPQYSCSWLSNPANNVAAAMNISGNGSDWTPWTTYCKSGNGVNCVGPGQGTYQQYMNGAVTPPGSPGSAPGIGGWENLAQGYAQSILDPFGFLEGIAGGIFSGAENFLQSLFGGWVSPFLRLPQALINIGWNFGGFVVGVGLLFLGALLLFGAIFEDGFAIIGNALNATPQPVKEGAIIATEAAVE